LNNTFSPNGRRIGFPFAFLQISFPDDSVHVLWSGIVGDCLFIVALAVAIQWIWASAARWPYLRSCTAGIGISFFIFAEVNEYLMTHPWCADCDLRVGVPFRFAHLGGWVSPAGLLWLGVLGDGLAIVLVGLAIGWSWNLLRLKRLQAKPIPR
jgi:hypothetical protein